MNSHHDSQKGATLIFITIMTLVSVLVVSLAVANVSARNIRNSTEQLYSAKSLFASESGLERSLWEARYNGIDISNCISGNECLDFSRNPTSTPACLPCTDSRTENFISQSPDYRTYYKIYVSTTTDALGSEVTSFNCQGWYSNIARQVEVEF